MPSPSPIRVFLLDDHELVRRGIRAMLESATDVVVVGEAATEAEACAGVASTQPHVAVLDVRLAAGTGSGLEACRAIRVAHPEVRCLMLTSFEEPTTLLECASAGASGYLLKRIRGAELVDDVRRVAAGGTLLGGAALGRARTAAQALEGSGDQRMDRLTAQEGRVLELLAEGLSNRQIGDRLHLTEKTVKNYVSSVLDKLGVRGRTEAAVYRVRRAATASTSSVWSTGASTSPSRSRRAFRNE